MGRRPGPPVKVRQIGLKMAVKTRGGPAPAPSNLRQIDLTHANILHIVGAALRGAALTVAPWQRHRHEKFTPDAEISPTWACLG